MIKILVVDDEPKIVEIVEAYLVKEGYEVIKAFNGSEALDIFENITVDLVILDLMLPDISGEVLCKKIREKSQVPIVMLTAKVEEENILEGFDLGADDYIAKPFSPRQMVARVNALIKRAGGAKKSAIISFNNGELKIDTESYEVFKNNNKVVVTPSEYKILLTLCNNPKRVFTREELLVRALGDEVDVFDRIIDSHIKNIRAKIEQNTKEPKYILTVHGIGYKFGGE